LIQTDKLIAEHKDRLIAPSLEDGMLRAAAAYVDAHVGDPIRLDDIARSLFISKSTLCHRFAKQMHMTINLYIAIKKMHRAADLLRKGHGATEVAAMVGYDNYTTFFYNFKRIMGASPTEMK
jgi:AraC-like DNA-binding protein